MISTIIFFESGEVDEAMEVWSMGLDGCTTFTCHDVMAVDWQLSKMAGCVALQLMFLHVMM